MSMTKKLIGFPDELVVQIEQYGESKGLSFTEAVRSLIILGLPQDQDQGDAPDFASRISQLEEKIDQMSWWTGDDNMSRMHNAEVKLDELEKKVNTVVAIAKRLKQHIEDREIHLQD